MKATLVKVDVASADLGKTAKEIIELADGGSLLEPALVWVFDLSTSRSKSRRELRFWRVELDARANGKAETVRGLEVDAVVNRILPEGRTKLFAGELDLLWQLRPRSRLDLDRQFARRRKLYHKKTYPRWILLEFLKRRWLGACYHRPHWQKAPTIPARARIAAPCAKTATGNRGMRREPDRARECGPHGNG
jgi:hypothetical protein